MAVFFGSEAVRYPKMSNGLECDLLAILITIH